MISLLTTLKISCIVAFSGAAAACDYRYRRLPNVLTVTALCCGFVFQIVQGATQSSWLGGWQGFVLALQGFATGFGLLLAIWLIGGGGAGDAKLMGALGAWLGAQHILFILVGSCFITAPFAFAGFLLANRNSHQPNNGEHELRFKTILSRKLPFAVPTAIMTWFDLVYFEILRPYLFGGG